MRRTTRVRELAAWGLDPSPYRESWVREHGVDLEREVDCARGAVSGRAAWRAGPGLVEDGNAPVRELMVQHGARADLRREMAGLAWSLGVCDLRELIAFQRRLVLDVGVADVGVAAGGVGPELDGASAVRGLPGATDWDGLVALAFGRPREVDYRVVATDSRACMFELRSSNPDLQVRLRDGAEGGVPFEVYGGSPFFEVAEYRGRLFLRDGYHRAYAAMRAGVWQMPAVVVRARSMEELGATGPWFFGEEVLFSERPPMLTDFLCDESCLEYERTRLVKCVRIVVEESVCEETAEAAMGGWPDAEDWGRQGREADPPLRS